MSICNDPPEERIRNVGHIMDHLEVRVSNKQIPLLFLLFGEIILIKEFFIDSGKIFFNEFYSFKICLIQSNLCIETISPTSKTETHKKILTDNFSQCWLMSKEM
jgi:acyl-CoA synthetase (AMP-forming)/AMP-acid ligase II